jgi:hypothetical protein
MRSVQRSHKSNHDYRNTTCSYTFQEARLKILRQMKTKRLAAPSTSGRSSTWNHGVMGSIGAAYRSLTRYHTRYVALRNLTLRVDTQRSSEATKMPMKTRLAIFSNINVNTMFYFSDGMPKNSIRHVNTITVEI